MCYRTNNDCRLHYDIVKMSDNKPKNAVVPNLCDWCGKPMPPSNHSKNLVCPRCYNLLLNAGLSEEKIYAKAIYKSGLLAAA